MGKCCSFLSKEIHEVDIIQSYYDFKKFEEILKYDIDKKGLVHCKLIDDRLNFNETSFTLVSLFNEETNKEIQEAKKIVNEILFNLPDTKSLTPLEEGAIGSMLGMAIGDSFGQRFEFMPCVYDIIEHRDFVEGPSGHFKLYPGQWTDDTSMGLCIADSLIIKRGKFDEYDIMHRFLAWWYGGYNNAFRYENPPRKSVGLGKSISESFKRYMKFREKRTKAGDKYTSGNGSIMRNAAIPILYHDYIEEACDKARLQSYITHQGEEAAECCALMTFIIVRILNGEDLFKILNNLGSTFYTKEMSIIALINSQQEGNNPNRNWNWKAKDYKYSPTRYKNNPGYIGSYSMDAMCMSLHCLYNTNSFSDAIIKVCNLRGDSDSVGSVVGQIAGAYYGLKEKKGIPKKWINNIYQWDHGEIASRGYLLVHLNDSIGAINEY